MDINDIKDALEAADYTVVEGNDYSVTYRKHDPRDNSYNEAYLDYGINKVEFDRYNVKDSLLAHDAFSVEPKNRISIYAHIR